jgi:peptidoglycan/LPS O-acetylase OafA/YrhL
MLLQDIIGSHSPNGAFWTIAVEWQIYFVFPVILLLARRTSLELAVDSTATVVIAAHFLAGLGSPFDKLDHLTPQFLALFAIGVLAVRVARRGAQIQRRLAVIAGAALAAVVLGAVFEGSSWMVSRYFWVDLVFGIAVACLLAVLYTGGAGVLHRFLTSRACLKLGLFSYSLYLVHVPRVASLHVYVIEPTGLSTQGQFLLTVAIGVPSILAFSYGFHLLFEAPFLRRRSLAGLREIPGVRALASRTHRAHAEDARTPAVGAPEPLPSTASSAGG